MLEEEYGMWQEEVIILVMGVEIRSANVPEESKYHV